MITYHAELAQGSEEWHAARCGMLTASEMKLIITPKLKIADNDESRSHVYELLAQRITGYVEPSYISDVMLRGHADEIDAIDHYSKAYAPVKAVGFVTNDKWGFTLGYSPDGLVGDDGQIECKSRSQKWQMQTLVTHVPVDEIDPDFMIQVQTGLIVTERAWTDLVSYCGGLPMATVRVFPDEKIQSAILEAAIAFDINIRKAQSEYIALLESKARLIPTERRIEQEMFIGGQRDPDAAFFTDKELSGGIPA
tara:strand:- start:46 stop:801 length:756 start_codon:yes stop_codon:yes gene_type:complete